MEETCCLQMVEVLSFVRGVGGGREGPYGLGEAFSFLPRASCLRPGLAGSQFSAVMKIWALVLIPVLNMTFWKVGTC